MIHLARLRWLLIPAIVACGWAGNAERPRCNADTRGAIWPQGNDRTADRPLEICTLSVWKYRWEQVTISVSQLTKDRTHGAESKAPPSGKIHSNK